LKQPGLAGFGVATLDEAEVLRFELGAEGEKVRILVFSSCHPWRREYGEQSQQFGVTPVLGSLSDFRVFLAEDWARGKK
jgi:alanine racemase